MASMPQSGLFITLYDEETLTLYLDKGIYGFLMPPIHEEVPKGSRHYHALADYACAREGTHVVFFLNRKIIYGGQIIGSNKYGSFYLNGCYSPLGKKANADLYWDESQREIYQATSKPGIFNVPDVGNRCQPYLIRFADNLGIKGDGISSDQLYWEIGKYRYPLPSNSIAGMSFCTLTPGEIEVAISLIKDNAKFTYSCSSPEDIAIRSKPMIFSPKYAVSNLNVALAESFFTSEAHLEAFVLANPELLPDELRPNIGDAICRQVPMSPFKPFQMDRANICYYAEPLINDGTLPNTIIELKTKKVGKNDVEQMLRYLKWLYVVLGESASNINVYLCGLSFTKTVEELIPSEFRKQAKLVKL